MTVFINVSLILFKVFTIVSPNVANINCFPRSNFKRFLKPYWDSELRSACKKSKAKHRQWVRNGKPRGNNFSTYTEYKDAKRDFRKIHRKKVLDYMSKLHEEIDRYAEIDSKLFWQCIKRRQSKARSAVGNELLFNNIVYRDPAQINENWANYFQNLYMPTENEKFDNSSRAQIKEELSNIIDSISTVDCSNVFVTTEDVKNVCDKSKTNKACGPDGCFYENFKYGVILSISCVLTFLRQCSDFHTVLMT